MIKATYPQTWINEFVRYVFVSLVALIVDLGSFSLLLRVVGLGWMMAAACGFVIGNLTAYLLSIRFVFRNRAMAHAPASELATFTTIGLLGLLITQAVLWFGIGLLHANPELSKVAAAGFTFVFNFLMRRALLFSRRRVIPPC